MIKKTALMVALATVAASSMGALIVSEDFESYTTGQAGSITNSAWIVAGNDWVGATDGVTGLDQAERLRAGNSRLTRYVDLTAAVAANGPTVELSFNTWYRDNATGGEFGFVSYTTTGDGTSSVENGTGGWTTTATYTSAANPQANYANTVTAFSIDTSGWTADQLANFGFGFGGSGQNNQDRFFIDNVALNVIPEPATLGMVSAMGAGLLFIRRRFMI
jgi:hypothetical protein